ncbi:MAG: SUMF1/EgtB/PvdO family nonheme iron enzyme [Saprospiraceae bacterium]|nr:SUMF1/EgtB/PvdO family nonheme iron enzyme [Saprospiraceae bacterium]
MKYSLALFVLLFSSMVTAQSLPISELPAPVRKVLSDYVFLEGGIFVQKIHNGCDSLQLGIPQRSTVGSFNINRYEVSVQEYKTFLSETGDAANRYDSTVWMTDFPYSFNQPMQDRYFNAKRYESYPIVGITYQQAVQYCAWKTRVVNDLLKNSNYRVEFRLPTAAEWEYAALGLGIPPKKKEKKNDEVIVDRRIYPWDGQFFQVDKKTGTQSFKCNSGPVRMPENYHLTAYASDGFSYTAPVKSFDPGSSGLYQMAGNVAEWTSDFYVVDADQLAVLIQKLGENYTLNPEAFCHLTLTFPPERYADYKIIKGGSWNDSPFYMQVGVVNIQHPEKARCTTGFRPVMMVVKR